MLLIVHGPYTQHLHLLASPRMAMQLLILQLDHKRCKILLPIVSSQLHHQGIMSVRYLGPTSCRCGTRHC